MRKVYILWAKKIQRSNLSRNWRGIKNLERNHSTFQNWHNEFDKTWPEHSKVSKIFILMGSFWGKYVLFELRKYRGIIFHETEKGYKIWWGIDSSSQNWHKEFDNLTWPFKSLKDFHFNGLLMSEEYIVWAKKLHRSNLQWNWKGIQHLERNRLVLSKLT